MNIDYNIQCDIQDEVHSEVQGEIIILNEDDIINFDNMIVGFIYIKKYGKKILKKKYFFLRNNIFEYWKSNKKTNDGVVRIKIILARPVRYSSSSSSVKIWRGGSLVE